MRFVEAKSKNPGADRRLYYQMHRSMRKAMRAGPGEHGLTPDSVREIKSRPNYPVHLNTGDEEKRAHRARAEQHMGALLSRRMQQKGTENTGISVGPSIPVSKGAKSSPNPVAYGGVQNIHRRSAADSLTKASALSRQWHRNQRAGTEWKRKMVGHIGKNIVNAVVQMKASRKAGEKLP